MRPCICFSRFGPYHLARLRAAAEVFPHLIALEWSSVDLTYAWSEETKDQNLDWRTVLQDRAPDEIGVDELILALESALGNDRPDIFVLNGWGFQASRAALIFAKRHNIPTVVMSESTPWDAARNPLKEQIKRQIVRAFDGALVGGRAHVDYLVQLGMARDRIYLGYDVIDNDYFSSGTARIRRASNLGETTEPENLVDSHNAISGSTTSGSTILPKAELEARTRKPEKSFFLASARFIQKKNHERLVSAYAQYSEIVDSHEAWDLVIVGDGELRSDLVTHIEHSGLDLVTAPTGPFSEPAEIASTESRADGQQRSACARRATVYLPGFKQYAELPLWYAAANAFVHPSTVEQWGLVVNEAMASRLPVIVSDRCGSAGELVRDGENGFLIDPYETESIRDALLRMHHLSQKERSRMGDHAVTQVEKFGPSRFAEGLKNAVTSVEGCRVRRLSLFQRALIRVLSR